MTAAVGDVYLLHHSIGLPPRAVRNAAVEEFLRAWDDEPADAWPAWLDQIDGFRDAVGRLLGVAPTTVSPQSNVSSGLTKLLGAVDFGSRRTIVMSERTFPSLGFVAQRMGFDLRFVSASAQVRDPDAWRRCVDSEVAAVIVTHAISNTGEVVPPAPLAALAHDAGAIAIVDVAQSAGVVPCDAATWGADAVVGTSVKWLCGGPGAGFLHVDADLLPRCRPTDVGWFSHADPFEFDIHRFVDAPDARRFWGGTPTVAPFAIARRTIEHLLGIGIDAVRAHNSALVARLLDGVAALAPASVASPSDPDDRSGTAVIDPGSRIDAVQAALAAAGVAVDRRAQGLRLSPHESTTVADIDVAIGAIASALR